MLKFPTYSPFEYYGRTFEVSFIEHVPKEKSVNGHAYNRFKFRSHEHNPDYFYQVQQPIGILKGVVDLPVDATQEYMEHWTKVAAAVEFDFRPYLLPENGDDDS
jgi:hypothetical protein